MRILKSLQYRPVCALYNPSISHLIHACAAISLLILDLSQSISILNSFSIYFNYINCSKREVVSGHHDNNLRIVMNKVIWMQRSYTSATLQPCHAVLYRSLIYAGASEQILKGNKLTCLPCSDRRNEQILQQSNSRYNGMIPGCRSALQETVFLCLSRDSFFL